MNNLKEGTDKSIFKQIFPHLIAILCFFVITMVYFSPVFQGKTLSQGDINHYAGAVHELEEYYKNEGVSSAWTGSMFSGMPAYQIGIIGGLPNFLNYLDEPLKILDAATAGSICAAMIMAYILFLAMGFGITTSVLGAIAYALASYNIIIIDAGHLTKVWSLVYLPLVMAGVVTLFKRKYWLGTLLLALGIAFQIKNNHLQITYYTGLLCVIVYLGFFIKEIVKGRYKDIFKILGFSLIALLLAVSSNIANLYANYEMSKESTRGQSELTTPTASEKKSSGLDKDYAFDWSYGKMETFTMLIPDIHGGSSGSKIDNTSALYKAGAANGLQLQMSPSYWGDQPFTSGPVYFGAIVCFLFVLGMIIIKNKMKWVLLAATIFFVFLSWGYNFDAFNSWLFYNFPLYNKFRTVSMALVIPSLTILVIAVWAVNEFYSGKTDPKKLLKALYWSLGITGGLCFFFWLLPDFFFNFTSVNDVKLESQVGTQNWGWFYTALLEDRKDMLTADALRSLLYIVLAAAVLWVSLKVKDKGKLTIWGPAILALLVLIDLWNVDRRYLDDSHFHPKMALMAQTFQKSQADNIILTDKEPSYRVLNLNNPFNESQTSYYHKSIGGYHAAKMKRYQELIEYRLQMEVDTIIQSFKTQNIDSVLASFNNTPSLNMLNAKYIIYHPDQPPLINPKALGTAWFVDDYKIVDNADAEIKSLNTIDPQTTAVVDKRYAKDLSGLNIVPDSTATIKMTVYKPDRLVYKSKAKSEQLAVFSEIYYANGWEAYVDGKSVPHFCIDWTLRGMRIPAGEHEVEFKFVPHTYNTFRVVSTASSAILVLLLIGIIGVELWNRKKKREAK